MASRRQRSQFTTEADWRRVCLDRYGERCRAACQLGWFVVIELDHIKPRSQGGLNDVENGLPLCSHHHKLKTDSKLKIDPAWLEPEQIEYLARVGWVSFDPITGEPSGEGWKHFLPMKRG
jgi:hypothetical protein